MFALKILRWIFIITIFSKCTFAEERNDCENSDASQTKCQTYSESIQKNKETSPHSPIISRLIHNGDNLFYKPQVNVGSALNNPINYYESSEDKEDTSAESKLENKCNHTYQYSNSKKPQAIPEPPPYMPLNPPKFPPVVINNAPNNIPQVPIILKVPTFSPVIVRDESSSNPFIPMISFIPMCVLCSEQKLASAKTLETTDQPNSARWSFSSLHQKVSSTITSLKEMFSQACQIQQSLSKIASNATIMRKKV